MVRRLELISRQQLQAHTNLGERAARMIMQDVELHELYAERD